MIDGQPPLLRRLVGAAVRGLRLLAGCVWAAGCR